MNKNNFVRVLVIGAVIGLGSQAGIYAADSPPAPTPEQQAMMQNMQKYGSPGEAHKVLEPFVGKWTAKVQMWMKPGDKVQESVGTNDNTWILGGRFLKQDYKGNWNGQPFEGMGMTGYDNVRGEYQTLWLDSMMTGMMHGTGSYDAASKTVTFGGNFSCPMTGEKARPFRSELKMLSNDKHTYTSYDKTPEGKEFKSMVITYTRVK